MLRIATKTSRTHGSTTALKQIFGKVRTPRRICSRLVTVYVCVACALAMVCATGSDATRQRGRELSHPNAPETPPGRRVALVIGNADYRYASALRNPLNDSRDMREVLGSYGFELLGKDNCSLGEMKQLILEFGRRLNSGGDVGLFYYAGHGVQVEGRNYLIPVDANIQSERQVEFEAVDVGRVINEMSATDSGINIVILDACRKNPFARSWRSASDGLAPLDPPRGMLIAFATLPNRVADDGTGRNGVFTSELLRQLRTPGLELEELFRRVRRSVDEDSGRRQIPLVTSTVIGDFYFSRDVRNVGRVTPPTGGVSPGALMPKGAVLPSGYLRSLSYQTVMADASGNIISRRQKQANVYTESINGVPLEMIEIPGGTFLMGTGEGERELVIREYERTAGGGEYAKQRAPAWVQKEMPQHTVRVGGFYMGKYEVTQAQWRAVIHLPRVNIDLPADPSRFKGDALPVEGIRWEEAAEFCRRLSIATRREYRLPSEAEWEYAARGGRASQFPLGDTITTAIVNFWGDAPFAGGPVGVDRETTTPVGSLNAASEFGLYDVSGNVWEWCADYWHESYAGAPADGTPWLANRSSDDHVVRGGSWNDAASYCRSASRGRDAKDRRATDRYGFRVVVSAR